MKEVITFQWPKHTCDICGQKECADYDGKTITGMWAYMCENCFKDNGVGLGLGKGQKLIYKKEK